MNCCGFSGAVLKVIKCLHLNPLMRSRYDTGSNRSRKQGWNPAVKRLCATAQKSFPGICDSKSSKLSITFRWRDACVADERASRSETSTTSTTWGKTSTLGRKYV